jgi:NAD(P)-dependent dehydrogenase (short-subunit alcohol dehydrogenase family)
LRGSILLLTASVATPMNPFRKAVLQDLSIALYGGLPAAVKDLLAALGARLQELGSDVELDDAGDREWARVAAPLDALICGEDDSSLAQTWAAVRGVATEAFIPRNDGRILLLAPRDDGVIAAALENLARTLSVEWARFGITVTALAPGGKTTDDQLATLVAFLCSPAGAYYSGCRFDLG